MKISLYEHLQNISKKSPKMITALIIIGILSIVLTLFVWFTPWSENGVDATSSVPVELGTREFYTAIKGITHSVSFPIEKGEEIKILNNGDEFAPDFLNEIKKAKHSVTIANYIWRKGEFTNSIFDAAIEKAKEGVEVRILMDASGSTKAPKDKIDQLEKAGGRVGKFRPIGLRTITRANKRSHMRAFVIDGKVGYIGGVAFDDEWLGDGTQPKEWRDIIFKVKGQGARSIQNMFSDLWRQTSGEVLAGEDFYPTLPAFSASDNCDTSCIIPLFHAPSPDVEKNLSDFLWLSIMGAKDHVYLETPYLLPNDDILKALKQKVKDGVRVEILVPGPHVDSRVVQVASRSYYTEMLDAGIHLYEYQPAHLHSKVITIDGHWSIVGSANLDNRSSTLNVEGIIGVEDKALAQGIETQFELDKSRSIEVTKDNLTLGITDHLFGHVSRLFAKQY